MISIGTDIVKVSRIKDLLTTKKEKFLNKVFVEEEISYCNSNSHPEIHFSGKYAAKEAIKKALLSNDIIEHISLKEIKVLNRDNKAPYIEIDSLIDLSYNVSISHEEEYAIAFALIQK
tara:strand:+ start:1267 stop:1620 length:354 start_codon:yes stop_codon:yes gene_type:complete